MPTLYYQISSQDDDFAVSVWNDDIEESFTLKSEQNIAQEFESIYQALETKEESLR